jgi:hypothetical protein
VDEVGKAIANLFLENSNSELKIKDINKILDEAALKISGIGIDVLTDENKEQTVEYRHYYTVRAELTAKAFIAAAQEQSYYGDWK